MTSPFFGLQFDTDNSAFDEQPATEIARILREVAKRVEENGDGDGKIFDANGNAIGRFYTRGNRES